VPTFEDPVADAAEAQHYEGSPARPARWETPQPPTKCWARWPGGWPRGAWPCTTPPWAPMVGWPDGRPAKTTNRNLSSEVAFLTRALKAPTLRESVARLAGRARAESWSHEEFLVACLQREVSARDSHGGEGRIRAARFPARKSIGLRAYAWEDLRMAAHGRDSYVLAGVNLREFVASWLSDLIAGDDQMQGLLIEAETAPDVENRYSYGASYVMAQIAPRAVKETATTNELLLFAVMAVYQGAEYPGTDPTHWDGLEAHIEQAFGYARSIGESEMAKRLRRDVIRRSEEDPPAAYVKSLNRSLKHDPAKIAAHEREMASIHRNIRAAAVLDPDGDFDLDLLQHQP
jgi:hypothetical protein